VGRWLLPLPRVRRNGAAILEDAPKRTQRFADETWQCVCHNPRRGISLTSWHVCITMVQGGAANA